VKGFITALGVIGAGTMFAVWALLELVARLAPVLIVAVIAWAVVATMRARGRRIRDDNRLPALWAQTRRQDAVRPPTQQPVAMPLSQAPHRERFYLVRGDDIGFAAHRDDGYLNVCSPALPPAAPHQPRVPALRRRCHRRVTHRSTRP
jgi:hypothetical protein